MGLQQAHHPLTHVGVEGVIGTAYHHVLLFQLLPRFEIRRSHRNTEGSGLSTASHNAAIVIRKHHHWASDQGWIEALLAGCIEVVAVNQNGGLDHG